MFTGPDYRKYLHKKLRSRYPNGRGENDPITDADVFPKMAAENELVEDTAISIRDEVLKPLASPEQN